MWIFVNKAKRGLVFLPELSNDFIFDKCLFTRSGKGKVIDIKVYKNPAIQEKTPDVITKFMDKYQVALTKFYKELIDAEHKLRYENKRKYGVDKLKLGRTLHKLLTDAYVNVDAAGEKFRQPLTLLHRKNRSHFPDKTHGSVHIYRVQTLCPETEYQSYTNGLYLFS